MFDGENAGASSDSSDGSDEIPHEKPEPIPHKERLATRPSESEEEGEEQLKPKPSSRKRRRAATTSESEPEEPTITVIPRKRQRRTIEIETSGDEEKQKKRSKRRGTRRQSTPEVEVVQVTSQNKRRKASKKAPTPDDDEDELIIQPPSSKRRSTRRRSPSVEDVEEQSPPRSTRRRIARRRSVSEDPSDDEDQRDDNDGANDQVDEEEQDELKEDLAFLRSSPLPDRGRLRSTHDKPKNKRQEALEALKRRRAGTTESSSATPGRKRAVVVETDSESELEVIKEEKDSDLEILDDDDIEDDDDDEEEDREANVLDMFQEDHEDENFIDDNADDIIGEPSATGDLEELRLMNHLSRAKPKELFKHAVEWMVMKKIHPAFESTKIIYTVTFRKLDDEVKGLAGSKFTSSAWTADFLRSIRARPELMIGDISTMERAVMSPHCEACNRSGHTATSELVLTGEPYNPETLEPLADPDDSDSDSDISADSEADLNGEKPAFNAAGERLVPSSHRFVLGSTCKANAQVAHTLHHWRYHLYDWVKDYLKGEGHLTAEKLVKRESRSNRKREKEARKIVDAMESKGEIAKLWRSYKNQVQFALDAQNEYRQGWGRK
jgi:hypothetical protein